MYYGKYIVYFGILPWIPVNSDGFWYTAAFMCIPVF